MGVILEALDGRKKSADFGGLIKMVSQNPRNACGWMYLADKLRSRAARSNSHDSSEKWHREAWDVCNRALKLNPNNGLLIIYIESYKQFLDTSDYSIE